MADPLVPVAVACPCPGAPHSDGDTVFLRPKLSLHAGVVADAKLVDIVNGAGDAAEIKAALFEVYLLNGVVEWTFTNEEGPVPVSPDTVRSWLMEDYAFGLVVAEAADGLYSQAVIAPLQARMLRSLPPTPTNGSTSATSASSGKRRTRSKRSSTITSPTADIVTT